MLLSNQSCGALNCGGGNQRKKCIEKWKDGDQCVFGTLKVMIDRLHMAGHKLTVTSINSRDLDKVPTCFVCALLKCQSMCVHY